MSEQPFIFADTVQEANIAHGVARLRMGQVTAGGAVAPAGTLIVPVSQLPAVQRALASVIRQIEQRARAAPGINDAPGANDAPGDVSPTEEAEGHPS